MDQYFNNFYQDDQSHHFSELFQNEASIESAIHRQHVQFQEKQVNLDKQQLRGTDFTSQGDKPAYTGLHDFQDHPMQDQNNQGRRVVRKIQVATITQLRKQLTFSGSKNDTVELNTNFKTLFLQCLKRGSSNRSEQSSKALLIFADTVPSFMAFSKMMNSNSEISKECSELIRSSDVIKGLMTGRAKFWMKLQMTKYIEALNMNLDLQQPVRWKSIRKRKKNREGQSKPGRIKSIQLHQ